MHTKKAFTLIEVMVVLSILAIIAILAYNFFGGTMKEASLKQATTKLYNDMRTMDDAISKYEIDNGTLPADLDALVTAGILKAIPTPPTQCWDGSGGFTYSFDPGYDVDMDADGNAVDDAAISLDNTNEDCADAFNAAFNDISGIFVYGTPTNYPGSSYIQYGISWDADLTQGNSIVWVHAYNP